MCVFCVAGDAEPASFGVDLPRVSARARSDIVHALGDGELRAINKAVGGVGAARNETVLRALQAYVYGRGFGPDLCPTLADTLAALVLGFMQLRPFDDSTNVRTAIAAVAVLAQINGCRIAWLSWSEAAEFCTAVAIGHPTRSYVARRIADRLHPL